MSSVKGLLLTKVVFQYTDCDCAAVSESSNYKLGRLDKMLVLKFVLTRTDRPTHPDTEFKMVRGRTIKIKLNFL